MIKKNLDILEEKISTKCKQSGRNRSDITLIAVSKMHPVSVIQDALDAGLTDFGENKAQELRDKAEEFKGDFNWHFVGHLQRNKVKYVIEPAEYIHSVDSVKLAKEIEKRAAQIEKVQKVLLEINTSGEEAKYGLETEEAVTEVAEFCVNSQYLDLKGLMTMAPFTEDETVIRNSFKSLSELKDKLNGNGFNLTELSMGMTNDYEIAIEEGATMLRIGTAIFGERDYSNN
jgi:pyridoxal phosphate enzyme (YggS family)